MCDNFYYLNLQSKVFIKMCEAAMIFSCAKTKHMTDLTVKILQIDESSTILYRFMSLLLI